MEELPLALEYGMTPHQFWDEDSDLLFAYQEAYINRTHKQSHITGLYVNLALMTTFSNMLKNKNAKQKEYPKEDVFNPFNAKNTPNKTSVISKIDTSKNNNGIYKIKKLIEERRKIKNA